MPLRATLEVQERFARQGEADTAEVAAATHVPVA